jgi:signal transduction histidine kinase/HAMP domain-containing protein
MFRLSIRGRLIVLTALGLAVLIATNAYLTRKLGDNSAGMVRASELLGLIEQANDAQLAFGELRYWMTDLAVSLLTLSEKYAGEAQARMEQHLDMLARAKPERIVKVRKELAKYEEAAHQAVEAYTDDRRVIGNTFLAQARLHSVAVDRLLAAIVTELTGEANAARERVVAEAATATRVSQIVVLVAVLLGVLLTFLVVRSIALPLRRLVAAMDGLNAGDTAVAIPPPQADEIGAMARTLAAFRDTLAELRETLAQLEALRAVGRAVGSTLDLETVLRLIVARAVEFSHGAAGVIYEYDEAAQIFHFRTSQGAEPELDEILRTRTLRLGEGTIGQAALAGAPVQIADLAAAAGEAPTPELWQAVRRLGYHSLLAAPLLDEEHVLGGLVVVRREAGDFPREIVGLVEAFATQSALAVRNAKAFEALARRERELRIAHEQLKATQANLIQAEKMASLGQLTAGIAHEIKNPLNFVNNFAELSRELLDEVKELIGVEGIKAGADLAGLIETLSGNLGRIVEHGRRADGIVTSMLLHSRGGSGERRSSDVNALVEAALNLAYHGARARDQSFNVTLERDYDAAIGSVDLVPQDITRVLLNLFGNGFYAIGKRQREGSDPGYRPTLKAATRDRGKEVELRVWDNGGGMSPEIREKLFTPFFTTKPTGEGTGLGLSISYDIVVQQHGGEITVESREGDYAEFIVRLPRHGAGALAAAATGASA